jgi:hypothetical protein
LAVGPVTNWGQPRSRLATRSQFWAVELSPTEDPLLAACHTSAGACGVCCDDDVVPEFIFELEFVKNWKMKNENRSGRAEMWSRCELIT